MVELSNYSAGVFFMGFRFHLLGFYWDFIWNIQNNIPNVFGRIVPKPMESAMYFGGIRISGESGSNWMVIGVTEP